MAFAEGTIMDGYLVKKSQIVAVLVFLIEIVGAVVLAQTNITDGILEKVGRVAILYCVISTTALYYVKREWDIFLGFMIMSCLFSFGQCILAAFGYKLGVFDFSMDRGFFSNKEILDASVFALILSFIKDEFQKAHGVVQYCFFSEREVAML